MLRRVTAPVPQSMVGYGTAYGCAALDKPQHSCFLLACPRDQPVMRRHSASLLHCSHSATVSVEIDQTRRLTERNNPLDLSTSVRERVSTRSLIGRTRSHLSQRLSDTAPAVHAFAAQEHLCLLARAATLCCTSACPRTTFSFSHPPYPKVCGECE